MCAVKLPTVDQDGIMSVLGDVSAYTGSTIVSKQMGMKLAWTDPVAVLGKTKEVKIDRNRSVFLGEESKTLEDRISFL